MTQFDMLGKGQGPEPKRLLLAVVLTSAVMMAYSYFLGPQVKPQNDAEKAPVAVKVEDKAPIVVNQENLPSEIGEVFSENTPADTPEVTERFLVKESSEHTYRSSYDIVVNSVGGVISYLTLTDFDPIKVLFDRDRTPLSAMSLLSDNSSVHLNEQSPYVVLDKTSSSIKLKHITREGLSVVREKVFLVDGKINENITLKNLSEKPLRAELHLTLARGDKKGRESSIFNPAIQSESITVKVGDKLTKEYYKDLLGKQKTFQDFTYIGFDEQYFLSAFIPKNKEDIAKANVVVNEKNDDQIASIDIFLKPSILMQDEEKTFSYTMFVGPKQLDLLASVTPNLDENIEFGWFSAISRPMLWMLVQLNTFIGNYGLAIILITILIKLLTYPLTAKSFASQAQMKKLQPELKLLQEKYGHDRTLHGQKQMEFYRANGVNPMAGCLPMLIQLPIWFAFFQMLRSSVELYHQPFYGWIKDLTEADPYYVLPIIMGVTMIVQQWMTPPPNDQPQMKYIMMGMPVFFTFIMLNMPAGLSLYMFTNNILTICQQLLIKNKNK